MKTIFYCKKIKAFFLFALIISILYSCKKTVLLYDKTNTGIFFVKTSLAKDSLVYSFAVKPDSLMMDTVRLPLQIIGPAASVDRPVSLLVVDSLTTAIPGMEFELLESVVKANEYTGNALVIVKRSPSLKTNPGRLFIKIKNTAAFPEDIIAPPVSNKPLSTSGILIIIKA